MNSHPSMGSVYSAVSASHMGDLETAIEEAGSGLVFTGHTDDGETSQAEGHHHSPTRHAAPHTPPRPPSPMQVHLNSTGVDVRSDLFERGAVPAPDFGNHHLELATAVGACVWAPRVLCIMSRFPFVTQFQHAAWQLYATVTSAHLPV